MGQSCSQCQSQSRDPNALDAPLESGRLNNSKQESVRVENTPNHQNHTHNVKSAAHASTNNNQDQREQEIGSLKGQRIPVVNDSSIKSERDSVVKNSNNNYQSPRGNHNGSEQSSAIRTVQAAPTLSNNNHSELDHFTKSHTPNPHFAVAIIELPKMRDEVQRAFQRLRTVNIDFN